MSASVDIDVRGIRQVIQNMNGFAAQKQAEVTRALDITALKLERGMKKKLSHPGTGRIYKRGTVEHQASAPGDPPATDTGRLRNSIGIRRMSMAREIGPGVAANTNYAEHLEYGTRTTAPRPFVRPVWENERQRYFRRIQKIFDV